MRRTSLGLLLFIVLNLLLIGCRQVTVDPNATRVLFVGNSYTRQNSLPGQFRLLAESADKTVQIGRSTSGSATLGHHVSEGDVAELLTELGPWDYLILQEQSVLPTSEDRVQQEMLPAAHALHELGQAAGAQTILYMTWGRQDGESVQKVGFESYDDMQTLLEDAYQTVATELRIPISPVGVAWQNALAKRPFLDLWQADGSHPTPLGTYLAACVFYTAIFNESPEGLPYHGEISADDAAFLQQIAAETVLNDPAKWGLPQN